MVIPGAHPSLDEDNIFYVLCSYLDYIYVLHNTSAAMVIAMFAIVDKECRASI